MESTTVSWEEDERNKTFNGDDDDRVMAEAVKTERHRPLAEH